MSLRATFEVFGRHAEDLTEAAYDQAVKFFRTTDDEISIVEMDARPVVHSGAGEVVRWKATVVMEKEDSDAD